MTGLAEKKAFLLAGLWVAALLAFIIAEPRFFQLSSVTTILQFSTMLGLVSLGQALVVTSGGAGIDLSVGGTVSLTSILSAMALTAGLPGFLLPVVCVTIGFALGAVNGVLVTRFRVLPLIATLGTFYVYGGLAVAITSGGVIRGIPEWLVPLGRGSVAGIPTHTLMVVIPAYLAASIVLYFAPWGRWIYAMGSNEPAARLVGIPVDRTRLLLYATSGGLAGLAALVANAWLGSGAPQYRAQSRTGIPGRDPSRRRKHLWRKRRRTGCRRGRASDRYHQNRPAVPQHQCHLAGRHRRCPAAFRCSD